MKELKSDDLMMAASFGLQMKMIMKRSFRNLIRNPLIFKVRMAQIVMFIIIINLLFRRLDDDEQSIMNRTGLLFILTVFHIMTNLQNVLMTFPIERALFLKE